MAKAELGEKQICPNCGSKFYDLGRRPAQCPKCATTFDPADETVRLKRVKTTRAPVYEADYEDDDGAATKRAPADAEEGFEEEVEEARELDSETPEEVEVVGEEEEEDRATADALPAGFSETDEDTELGEAADGADEGVPLLEDDEEFEGDDLSEGAPEPDEDATDR